MKRSSQEVNALISQGQNPQTLSAHASSFSQRLSWTLLWNLTLTLTLTHAYAVIFSSVYMCIYILYVSELSFNKQIMVIKVAHTTNVLYFQDLKVSLFVT